MFANIESNRFVREVQKTPGIVLVILQNIGINVTRQKKTKTKNKVLK